MSLAQGRRAAHRFSFWWDHPTGGELEPGNAVLVEFILSEEGNHGTRLRVTESNLEPLGAWPDADKQRYAEEHNEGWGRLPRPAGPAASRPAALTGERLVATVPERSMVGDCRAVPGVGCSI